MLSIKRILWASLAQVSFKLLAGLESSSLLKCTPVHKAAFLYFVLSCVDWAWKEVCTQAEVHVDAAAADMPAGFAVTRELATELDDSSFVITTELDTEVDDSSFAVTTELDEEFGLSLTLSFGICFFLLYRFGVYSGGVVAGRLGGNST